MHFDMVGLAAVTFPDDEQPANEKSRTAITAIDKYFICPMKSRARGL
jgi:hypothetical protein